jgi:hypothetical protein
MVAFVLSSRLTAPFALVAHSGKSSDLFRYDSLSYKITGGWHRKSEYWLTWNSGIGQAYWQVILGRIITGCGASGTVSLASIIITGKMISLFLSFFLFLFKKVLLEAN